MSIKAIKCLVEKTELMFPFSGKEVDLNLVIDNEKHDGEYITENPSLKVSQVNNLASFEVTLTKTVGTWDGLLSALEEPHFRTIILSDDITLEATLFIERAVNLDLNENSLINDDSDNGFIFLEEFQGKKKDGSFLK